MSTHSTTMTPAQMRDIAKGQPLCLSCELKADWHVGDQVHAKEFDKGYTGGSAFISITAILKGERLGIPEGMMQVQYTVDAFTVSRITQ